ncbi:hypothetical protein [Streptomyces mirabilis]|uniref:hypothetical protein n=1 Tax=Streptomyces mirabilis TaxID=68239 RepID=UPI0036A29E21
MLRSVRYVQYAIRHHWTPRQVDEEIPADIEPYFLDVEDVIQEEAKRRAKQREGMGT